MWLVLDQDRLRLARTEAFLKKQGISITGVAVEEEIPTKGDFTVAIFFEGWNSATVERVKKQLQINVLLCLPMQGLTNELYADILTQGYNDIVSYPPSQEYIRKWEKKEQTKQGLEQFLDSKNRKSTYTQPQESKPFENLSSIPRKAAVWAVVGVKGGVGKTTFSSLLANSLKSQGKKVIVADLDPQGNLAILHKIERHVTADRFETLPDVVTETELEQNMVKTPQGWWLVPKGDTPLGLTKNGVSRLIYLASLYADVLILDCHPAPLVSTVVAAEQADVVWTVTTSDRAGWTGIGPFLKGLKLKGQIKVIMNRVREKDQVAASMVKFLAKQTGVPVAATIAEDKILYQRVQDGLSIMGSRKTEKVIQDLLDDTFFGKKKLDGKEKQRPKRKGFLGRLFG